jgi:hypothetical protein
MTKCEWTMLGCAEKIVNGSRTLRARPWGRDSLRPGGTSKKMSDLLRKRKWMRVHAVAREKSHRQECLCYQNPVFPVLGNCIIMHTKVCLFGETAL